MAGNHQIYAKHFYENQAGGSARSASVVVPLLVNLLKPRSVLDVGCGAGTWCEAYSAAGVPTVHGVDGPWVDQATFRGPSFSAFDFSTASMPFSLDLPTQRFDMAMTLEFVEHVEADRAQALVDLLTSVSDVVVFGAAIPGQGGKGHVNEQWLEYWREMFEAAGYTPFDAIRPLIWSDDRIQPWYRQNTIIYFKGGVPAEVKRVAEAAATANLSRPGSMVHPAMFQMKVRGPLSIKARVARLLRRLFNPIPGEE